MRADRLSLRRQIMSLAVILLLSAALLLVVFIRDYAHRAADRAFDRLLAASALTIAGSVQVEDGAVAVELPFAAFAMFSGGDRVFYAVQDPEGRLVTGYPDIADGLPLAGSVEPVFADGSHNGEAIRIASLGRLISTARATGWVTIRVAETRDARQALSAEILGNAITPLVLLTALAIAMVWMLIGRTFAPLRVLERVLRDRRPDDLSPVDAPVPVEVQQLVTALNGFMARLRASMNRMSGLVTEAAHQVRNPLASLRAQAELALGETDDAGLKRRVERIHEGAVQSSHLVTQLLMDATISHRLDFNELQPVPIGSLVEEVVGRLDPDARPRVSVTVTDVAARSVLPGDRVGLREMLRNLVENALKYSDGPIAIETDIPADGELRLAVLDCGPGISDAEKPLVMQRFRRGSGTEGQVGSGLGLAIVARVVEGHGGRLALSDRPGGGLCVEVRLPLPRRGRDLRAAALTLALVALVALARPAVAEPIVYPATTPTEPRLLTIVGTTDTAIFSDFIHGFQAENPGVGVRYVETDTLPLYRDYLAGTLDPKPDLLISSAADLQMKLANDGHALVHSSADVARVPAWAQWRSEVFGFTFEPAVVIHNPDLIAADEVPRTHLGLAEFLEAEADRLRGRVATYDISVSGVGYLLAVQDEQISTQFWRLANAFGRVSARLSGSSPQILDQVARGELALGYNVLGSYAFARQAEGARIGIVVPDDYVLVLTRTMLIPRDAPNPDLARVFVDFAVSPSGQRVAAGRSALGALVPGTAGEWTLERITGLGRGAIQPVALGPVLMVALDPHRRDRFLSTWQGIVAPRRP